MNQILFIATVLQHIGTIPDERDYGIVRAAAEDCFRWGFTIVDAVRFLRCLEEVNPDLAEDAALRGMRIIRDKYKKTT